MCIRDRRSVAEFLSDYDKPARTKANIRTNTLTLKEVPQETEDLQTVFEFRETETENEEKNEATSSGVHQPFNAREEVAAFFKELEEEEWKSTTSTGRLTVATAKVKSRRPDITEITVPNKWDEEHGGPRACIICMKPDLPMAYLRTHFQFNHRVSIGDPISKSVSYTHLTLPTTTPV